MAVHENFLAKVSFLSLFVCAHACVGAMHYECKNVESQRPAAGAVPPLLPWTLSLVCPFGRQSLSQNLELHDSTRLTDH